MMKPTLYLCIFVALVSVRGAVAESDTNNLTLLNKLREENLVKPAPQPVFNLPANIEQEFSGELPKDIPAKKDASAKILLTAQWYKQQLSELNNKNKKLQSEIIDVRKKLALASNEPVPQTPEMQAKEVARQLSDVQQALLKANEENARLADTAKQAEQNNAKLQAQLTALTAQQTQSAAQSSKQLADAQAAVKQAEQNSTKLQAQLSALTAQQTQSAAQQAQATARLAEAQAAEKKASNENLRLQSIEKQAAQAKTTAEAQIASLTAEKTQLSAQVAKQQTEALAGSKQWAEEKAALTTELAALKKQPPQKPLADTLSGIPSTQQTKTAITADNQAGQLAKRAYSLGYFIGLESEQELKKITAFTAKVDQNIFLKGLLDRFKHTPLLTDKEIEASLAGIDNEINKNAADQGNKNKAINEKVMAKAAKMKNAVKAKSNFIYIIHQPGSQLKVMPTDTVRIQIKEKLGDGTVIASEKDNNVIAASVKEIPLTLQEVIVKLGIGGEATLYIPPNLAYGEKGVPGKIPPNSLSIMTIKVLGIKQG